MLEVAVYMYFAAGVGLSLMHAYGIRQQGVKSPHPTVTAIVYVTVSLLLWPVVVVEIVRQLRGAR